MPRLFFLELPIRDLEAAKSFYSTIFGFNLTDFGPSYSCTMTQDVDLGLQADAPEAKQAPLAVISVDNLERTLLTIEKSGGTITRPIFSYPGGRRFQFRDPSGNELAAAEI